MARGRPCAGVRVAEQPGGVRVPRPALGIRVGLALVIALRLLALAAALLSLALATALLALAMRAGRRRPRGMRLGVPARAARLGTLRDRPVRRQRHGWRRLTARGPVLRGRLVGRADGIVSEPLDRRGEHVRERRGSGPAHEDGHARGGHRDLRAEPGGPLGGATVGAPPRYRRPILLPELGQRASLAGQFPGAGSAVSAASTSATGCSRGAASR